MSHFNHPKSTARSAVVEGSLCSIGAYPPKTGKAAAEAFRTVCAVIVLGLLAIASGCAREAPEAALRATIARMQADAERRDARAVVASVSADFIGPEGMDRDGLRRMLAVVWLRDKQVGVTLGPVQVELIGDGAKATFTAGTTGGAGWLPERAQLHQVNTGWRLEDGEWRLLSASWKPVL